MAQTATPYLEAWNAHQAAEEARVRAANEAAAAAAKAAVKSSAEEARRREREEEEARIRWAERVQSHLQASKEPVDEYVCEYTKKRFKTLAAYENHKKSKKYSQLVAQAEAAKQQAAASRPAEVAGPSAAAPAAATVATAADGDSDGWEDFDDDEPWEPQWNESIFDGHASASFEANARYMRRAHSFFVPDMSYLVDARGLFSYLQEKVCRHHTCVFCNRVFGTLEACRGHMRDKSHCKVNLESESSALELSEFYDFGSRRRHVPGGGGGGGGGGGESSTDGGGGGSGSGDVDEAGDGDGDGDGSSGDDDDDPLVGRVVAGMLPNGRRLGHRADAVYYKQSSSFTRLYSQTSVPSRLGMRKAADVKAKAAADAASKQAAAAAAAAEAAAAARAAAVARTAAEVAEARARAARDSGVVCAAVRLRCAAVDASSVRLSWSWSLDSRPPAATAAGARSERGASSSGAALEEEARALRERAEAEAATAAAKREAAAKASAEAAEATAAAAEEESRLETCRKRFETSIALRDERRRTNGALVRSAAFANGSSKALAATYTFKEDVADNKHARALVHHGYGNGGGGAHFTMSGSRQFHKGVKLKGIIQRKAGKAKAAAAQATRNKANRGNASIAVKR